MCLKKKLNDLYTFLNPYQNILNIELIGNYPKSIDSYPKELITPLLNLSQTELWQIDSKTNLSKIENTPLMELIEKAEELCNLPTFQSKYTNSSLPVHAYHKVKSKKKHELDQLIPLLRTLKEDNHIQNIIDIGGGVGHLTRILKEFYNIESTLIDYNKDLLDKGKIIFKKKKIKIGKDIKIIHMDVNKTPLLDFNNKDLIFSDKSFIVGLHACGPLSIKLIEILKHYKSKGILSFGCCYLKCCPKKDVLLSAYAKEHPIQFTPESLTLATRAYSTLSLNEFLNKERVKKYRYALHLLFYHHLNIKDFFSVGDSPIKTYWDNFSNYAQSKINQHKIQSHLSILDLENFYSDKKIQKLLSRMFIANMIRWIFSRPLELYLLTDRALYLEESGYKTQIIKYFDETISPRNIGILALRK